MEWNLAMVINQTVALGTGMSVHINIHYQFCIMFLQTYQEILCLKEIFQNIYSKVLDILGHLWNHPASVQDTKTTAI